MRVYNEHLSFVSGLHSPRNHEAYFITATELRTKFIEAQRHYVENTTISAGLEKSIEESEWGSKETIEEWRLVEADFKKKITDINNHAELKKNNPYEMAKKKRERDFRLKTYVLTVSLGITQKEALQHLKTLPTLSSVNGEDLLGTIQRGMKLEHDRYAQADLVQPTNHLREYRACLMRSYKAEESVDRWEQKAEAWLESAQLWYADHDKYLLSVMQDSAREGLEGVEDFMTALVQPINPEVEDTETAATDKRRGAVAKREAALELMQEMKEAIIRLPYAWDVRLRKMGSASEVIKAEIELRKGEANDMLEDLRTHLLVNYSLFNQKKITKGQKAKTRLQKSVERKRGQQNDAAAGYRRARMALLALGAEEMEAFPPLHDDDVKVFSLSMGHTRLGSSREATSWIWGDVSFANGQTSSSEYLQESE